MRRRTRRSVPATAVALVVLAAAVLVATSCVQLLLGQAPVLPLSGIGQAAATLTPSSPAVIVAAVLAALLGAVLLWAGLVPGAATVLPLSDTGTGIDTGVTRRSLDKALAHTAEQVDGVEHARVHCTRRRAAATVRTGIVDPDTVRAQVEAALTERLSDIAPTRGPRVSVTVSTGRTP